jgi:hypothetical protein
MSSSDLERLVQAELGRYRCQSREKIVRGGAERARDGNRLAANGVRAVYASPLGQHAASARPRGDGVLGSEAPDKAIAQRGMVVGHGM